MLQHFSLKKKCLTFCYTRFYLFRFERLHITHSYINIKKSILNISFAIIRLYYMLYTKEYIVKLHLI